MNDDFAAAMRRSLEETRAGDPMKATRLIQAALEKQAGTAVPNKEKASPGAPVPPEMAVKSRRLGDVISGLARRPKGLEPRRAKVNMPPIPDGASFERLHHTCSHGARDYRLYRPSQQDAPVRGVVLMLHGCTQSPEDFARGTQMNLHAEKHGLVVVYPEQTRSNNATLCWNWFRPGDQGRSHGEPALLADLAVRVAATYDVPPTRVFAAGLSAGGAMAAILVQTHPDVFRAAGVHSGLASGSAHDVVSAFGAMRGDSAPGAEPLRAPAIIFHGSADATVAPVNAGRLAGPLQEAQSRSGSAGGRRYDVLCAQNATGHPVEVWRIDGAGHAWSGGHPDGSYADPMGPDASEEMTRFFLNV